jgi:crotonobetainyl-CoA:carnitine CoA-transferase CaiB-like acyl-CoA transferase
MTNGPLSGVTVLDLSRVLAGPYCTMLAADMGARVIKIEHPIGGDDTRAWGPPFQNGESAYYLSINRNKESVALNFKAPEGRAVLDALIAKADVVVENFRPGTLDAMGLGYRDLATKHPRLIYVSISGYGQTGPRRAEAGYDAVAQGESGLMSITGQPDRPAVRVGVAIADLAAGMFAFQGLLLALVARAQTARGQLVDVGLLDAVTGLLTYQTARYFATGEAPERTGNKHMTIAPYETFETKDGVLVLAVGNDTQWQRLCRTLGLDALAGDARFTTNDGRVRHSDALRPALDAVFASRSLVPLIAQLRDAGVPCGAVRDIAEALADPQILAREMVHVIPHATIGSVKMLGIPVKLSATPGSVRTPPPRLGEHTARVLREDLGMDGERIGSLVQKGIVVATI